MIGTRSYEIHYISNKMLQSKASIWYSRAETLGFILELEPGDRTLLLNAETLLVTRRQSDLDETLNDLIHA